MTIRSVLLMLTTAIRMSWRRETTPVSSWLVIISLFTGCMGQRDETGEVLFIKMDPAQTKIRFVNHLSDTGDLNILSYLYYYNGGGVAAGDVNNDGFTDLYFVSNLDRNKLYINERNWGRSFSFRDVSAGAGVEGRADWQTGVTLTDVDGDGWLDIYVCAVSDVKGLKGSNELYINNGLNEEGEVTFTERAAEYGLDFSGFSTQAAFFDYDKDGDLDMYLLNHAVHTSRSYGNASDRVIADQHAGDYLFENQLVPDSTGSYKQTKRFIDVSKQAGIYQAAMGYGLGIAVADLNNDGWDDIYVGNDFHEDDYFYINNGDGTFRESLKEYFGHVSRFSMGCDVADINNDGYQDLMTLDMLPEDEAVQKTSAGEDPFDIFLFKLQYGYYYQYSRNCLQMNIGGKAFSDQAFLSGVAATDWSWSALLADYDNDGIKDIFITNGIVHRPNDLDYIKFISNNAQRWTQANARTLDRQAIGLMPEGRVHNYMYQGTQSMRFEDKSISWGFGHPSISTGAAYADLDNDGDLDIITNNVNDPAGIYRNDADELYENNFLKVKLNGNGANRFGLGAMVFLKTNGSLLLQQMMPTRGFLSSSDPVLNFGLGDISGIDTLIVVWGDGSAEMKTQLPVNKTIALNQHEANGSRETYHEMLFQKAVPVLEDETSRYTIEFSHRENTYHDFYKEALIPFEVSTEGPHLAVGDVNGDGLDDFFAGGAHNQTGKLFIQDGGNTFYASGSEVFSADSVFEDVDATFFDADNDNDLDLYVVSGGNQVNGKNSLLSDRLYTNDGKGNFLRQHDHLPEMFDNKSCVRPCDIDKDGDIDLFVGGRVMNQQYGYPPNSYLLINDGTGKFSDETDRFAPTLRKAGMVTDAQWFDWDRDGDDDLIIVGDWMLVRIFRNESDKLVEANGVKGLERSNGFWQTIEPGDFDGDGDTDFMVGNLGDNTRFRKDESSLLRLYVKDIDQNGSLDHILAYRTGDQWYPAASKDELSKQLPLIRKKFQDYAGFAGKTVEEIFDDDELKDAYILEASVFSSMYLENTGGGQFEQHRLPEAAQVTKIFAFHNTDLDDDGDLDVLVGGNFYGSNMYQGRYDSGYGLMLRNVGKSGFQPVGPDACGFFLKGEVRDIRSLRTPGGQIIIAARNNLPLKIFKRHHPEIE